MYNFMYKNKGAISIFLIIVFVPMLVVSSIFVDMSRIRLANAVATSAGDLTMNTALTNYDAVLKQMYGLFATSQDMDELFENLEDYYKECIESAGIPEAEAEDYVGQVMALLKSESGTDDLLNMNLSSFEVSSVDGSNLANPAVLKSQIVEFMKYRAPINLGTSIIEAAKSMKNLQKQTALVENKNAFYAKQASMMEDLEKAWSHLADYQYRYNDTDYAIGYGESMNFPGGDLLSDVIHKDLQDEAKLLGDTSLTWSIRYLYYAQENYNAYTNEAAAYGVEKNASPKEEEYTEIWTVKQSGETNYYVLATPEDATVEELKGGLEVAWKAIQAMKTDDPVMTELTKDMDVSALSFEQKVKKVSTSTGTLNTNYHKKVKNFVAALVTLKNLYNGCDKTELGKLYVEVDNSSKTYTISEKKSNLTLKKFVEDQINHLNETESDFLGKYEKALATISACWVDTNEVITSARSKVTYYLEQAYLMIQRRYGFVQHRIDRLSDAISILNTIKGNLENQDSDYNKALREWKKSASELSSDSMGKADQNEIARLNSVLTVDKVKKLITRLTAAKNSLIKVQNELKAIKVFGVSWMEIGENPSYNFLLSKLEGSESAKIESVSPDASGREQLSIEISGVGKNLTASYNKNYDSIIKSLRNRISNPKDIVTLSWDDANSPDLTKQQDALFTWLYNNFGVSDYGKQEFDQVSTPKESSKIADSKNNADASQSSLDKSFNEDAQEKKPSTLKSRTLAKESKEFLPSKEWERTKGALAAAMDGDPSTEGSSDDELKNSTSGLSVFKDLIEAASGMATDFRDNMYVANYIMNMLSYSTYESELVKKYNEDTGNSLDVGSWYESKTGEDGTISYTLKEKYNIAELQKEAKTLTKVGINPNANYLYGGEIEYIIYGSESSTTYAYGTIYMIRFALNTVYAFTDGEINSITTSAATALFGTPPLTPLIPIAKIAFTIALALAESAYDLYQLKMGEAIPLIKSKDTFVMKPSMAAKTAAGEILTAVVDKGVEVGLNKFNEALEMTDDELTALISDKEGDFEELLTTVSNSAIDEFENYANEAIEELVSICNNVNLLEMEKSSMYTAGSTPEKVEATVTALKEWLAEEKKTSDAATYEVKKLAVDYITSNTDKISELYEAISNPEEKAAQELGEAIKIVLEDIREDIRDNVDALANQAASALNQVKDKALSEIKTAAEKGANELRNALQSKVSAAFGTTSGGQKTGASVVNSLLSWRYSNYLELFLIVGILAAPESILLRTADVIQLNMQHMDGQNYGWTEVQVEKEVSRFWGLIKYTKSETEVVKNEKAYQLSNALTHVKVKATIEVKPLLMTLPLMADTVKSEETGTSWYRIQYEGILGY